jgi:hypothetical protein
LSVSIWRTIHPKTTVVSSLGPGMRGPFWVSFITFIFLFMALLELRLSLERSRAKLDELHLAAEDAGLEN